MKASEIRESSNTELKDKLVELRKEQFNLRMQEAAGDLSSTDQYRKIRRDIARIKTVMNEKR